MRIRLFRKFRFRVVFILIQLLFVAFLVSTIFWLLKVDIERLGERETYLEEQVASLSFAGDSVAWVGTEHGLVWRMCKGKMDNMRLSDDRIYRVYEDPQAPGEARCWVGFHANGLQLWTLKVGVEPEQLVKYEIKGLGTTYTAFDVLRQAQHVYVATSHGLYIVPEEGNVLEPVITQATHIEGAAPDRRSRDLREPYAVTYIYDAHLGRLLISSPDGLLLHHTESRTTVAHHAWAGDVKGLSMDDDMIYTFIGNEVFIDRLVGNRIDSVSAHDVLLPASTYRYYDGMHLFASGQMLYVSGDLESYTGYTLRRRIPTACNHVMEFNHSTKAILLATVHGLWYVPATPDVYDEETDALCAAFDDGTLYVATEAGMLLKAKLGETEAKPIYMLDADNAVSHLMVNGNRVYYVADNRILRMVKLSPSFGANILFAESRDVYTADHDITVAALKPEEKTDRIYLSMVDEMICLGWDGSKLTDSARVLKGSYITAFETNPNSQDLAIATRNHGVYYGRGTKFSSVVGTHQFPRLKDVSMMGEYKQRLLFLQNNLLNTGRDSLPVEFANRLFTIGDSIAYVLEESGLVRFRVGDGVLERDSTLFPDLHFFEKAVVCTDSTLFVSSGADVIAMRADGSHYHIELKGDNPVGAVFRLLVAVLAVLATLSYIFLLWRRYHRRKYFLPQASAVRQEIEQLKAIAGLVGGERLEDVVEAERKLEAIRPSTPQALVRLQELLEEVKQLIADYAEPLKALLREQEASIAAFHVHGGKARIDDTQTALLDADSIALFYCAKTNERFIHDIIALTERLDKYWQELRRIPDIPGLTAQQTPERQGTPGELRARIEDIDRRLPSTPRADIDEEVVEVDAAFNRLFSEAAVNAAKVYARQRLEGIDRAASVRTGIRMKADNGELLSAEELGRDRVAATLVTLWKGALKAAPQSMRVVWLENIGRIDKLTAQYLQLAELRDDIRAYSAERRGMEQAATNAGEPVAADELEAKIAARNAEVVRRIGEHIDAVHALLVEADGNVFTDTLGLANADGQAARVFILLLANPRVKRLYLSGMLGTTGNLNPVVSRLMNQKLKPALAAVAAHVQKHPTSLLTYVPDIIDK